jgi:hypothetical protein
MEAELSGLVDDESTVVNRYETPERSGVAVDFGTDHTLTLDVVGDTVIVVAEDGDLHYELTLPESDAKAFIHNGILTIEVNQ